MADTQGLGRWMRSWACGVLILFYCMGCAASPRPAGTGPQAESLEGAGGKPTSANSPPTASSKRADRILGLTAEDRVGETIIRVSGNGPFQDYQFQRAGDDRFSLELGDIATRAKAPVAMPSTDQLTLSVEDGKIAGQGILLLGSLKKPIDHYVVSNVGNDLVVALYLAKQEMHRAEPPMSSPPLGSKPPTPLKKPKKDSSVTTASARTAKPDPVAKSRQMEAQRATEADLTGAGALRKRYTGKPISLDLLDADLRNVLRLIADITGSNIVIEPDVGGKVTLKVENVPWDQVLDMVLSMNDLGKEQSGNVVRIARLSKIKQELTQQAEEIKAKQALLEAAKDMGEITTAYLSVNYAQPSEIAGKIGEVKSEKGKISVDERTSLIIYSDYPARIENARQLMAKLDKATPQVLIEARIVRLSTKAEKDLGIRWRFQSDFGTTGSSHRQANSDFLVNHPTPGDLFKFSYAQLAGALWSIDLQLSALETATQGKILSAPKVLTVNNVKAVISQGTQIPYLSANQASPVSGGATATAATTEFRNAVLELQVTPHITPDRKVRLEMQVTQDKPSGELVQGQPVLDTRKITTELLVDDGNTIVIGGVLEDNDSRSMEGTPGLDRIPILGRLFKNEIVKKDKSEMLIFICPKIVDAGMISQGG